MDELNKIPPVTRFLVLGSLGLTVPVILKLVNPSPLVLFWPYVLQRFHFWRPVTSFFIAGGGIQLIFDTIALFRSSAALEEGEPFYRSTSTYAWTLVLTNALILVLNVPLGSAVLFRPMLYAITTFWSRAYAGEAVNFFGVVNVRAPLLPYTYLVLDVLMAGPHLAMQGGTGILAAYAIHLIRDVVPRPPPGSRLAAQGSVGTRLLQAVQRFVCEPPLALQHALPDSVDPVSGASVARPNAGGGGTVTGQGRAVRSTPFGTAFAPRGRAFGSAPTSTASTSTSSSASARASSASAGADTQSTSSSSSGGWFGGLFSRGGSSGSGSASAGSQANDSEATRRQAILDAIERRNRAARENSIAGRAQAAAAASSAPAGSSSIQGSSQSSALASSAGSAVRRTAASASSPSTKAQGASGNIHSLSFGSAVKRDGDETEPELDASGSGGRVAEERRSDKPADEQRESSSSSSKSAQPPWGGNGGRRLDE